MATTTTPQLRVLFFDVFGTCVAQRQPVADELWRATKEALESDVSSIDSGIRAKAMEMPYEQWFEFGGEWNKEVDKYTHEAIAKYNNVDWRAVDKYRLEALHKLLALRRLVIPVIKSDSSEPHVKKGSLWTDSQLKDIALAWHRLTPWSDTCRGLDLLNKKFFTATLSNTYNELLEPLVSRSSISFTHIFSSDMFQSYKPDPKVYLGAAEKMGVKPEECGLVAAHLNDLRGAKKCGFYAIYVERPLEEKTPELRDEGIPDLWIKEDEDGFLALAQALGVSDG